MSVLPDLKSEVVAPDPMALIGGTAVVVERPAAVPDPSAPSAPMSVAPQTPQTPQATISEVNINGLLQEITAKPAQNGSNPLHYPAPEPQPQSVPVEIPASEPQPQSVEDLLEDAVTKKGPTESLKALRQRNNDYKAQLEAKEAEIAEREARLKAYEDGEVISEPVKKKLERVSQLEQYEKLHALKTTPEFQEKYVAPIEDLRQKASQIAEDYKQPIGVIEKAYHIVNKRDQNAFLLRHFDQMGASEVKDIIEDMREANNALQRAELEPAVELQRIIEDKKRFEANSLSQRSSVVQRNANSGWGDALNELTSKGDYPELTLTGNPDHDDKYVKPLLEEAAKEFGKAVKALTALGASDLPPELAKILATRFLLSQASSVMAASRAHHFTRAEEAISSSRRTSNLIRPQVGGGVVTSSGPAHAKVNGLEDAASQLLKKVLPNL